MAVRIIVDSTADLIPGSEKFVSVVPLTVRFGDREYVQGVDITNEEFYEKLICTDQLPTTSQATPYQFTRAFEEAVAAGDDVVCITLSAKLSGTNQSANLAAEEWAGRVFVVDSGSVAIGAGVLIQYAIMLQQQGLSAEAICIALEQVRGKIRLLAVLDTLEYLKKGGRISKTVAFAGELLQLKPAISICDGQIAMAGKARGAKQGNKLLLQLIQQAGGVNGSMPSLLGYTGLSGEALEKFIADSAHLWQQPEKTIVGSVVGTHAGPGAVAVAFFTNTENAE